MEFLENKTPSARTPAGTITKGESSTKHTLLSLYEKRPQGDITLEEFESLALSRLRGGLAEE